MNTTNQSQITKHKSLNIGWLYPELMSTYGDRGNIIVLEKRIEWHGMKPTVIRINQNSNAQELNQCDILFMGGAQDIQQEIVNKDLINNKGKRLSEMIKNGTPGLFICGAYQFLGKYYKDSYGNKIKGLGLFDMYTESSQDKSRLIGNIIVKPQNLFLNLKSLIINHYLVGFENHGGRTYLADESQSFAKVISGHGNNGEDKTEGIHYLNAIGTYLHGPILPSNPELADFLIEKAYAKKYNENFKRIKIDDTFSEKAKLNILKRMKASY